MRRNRTQTSISTRGREPQLSPTQSRRPVLRSGLEHIKVEMPGFDLFPGDGLADSLQTSQRIDRIELLHAYRIDVATTERLESLRRQLGIVASVAEELSIQRPA